MSANEFGLQGTIPHNNEPTPIELCDVSNPELLARYRCKRAEWLSWYSFRADDPNSIEGQIIGMVFLDLSYRVLTKPRAEVITRGDIAASSGILTAVLDQGYVATQVLAIRRLLDKRPDVFSIRRLLDDIASHQNLITREIFVAHDGTPYDPAGWQALPPSIEFEIFGIEAPTLFKFLRSSERHEIFDKLSSISPANRNRQDTIRIEIFEKLRSWLESVEAEKLVKLSHKFLAHAADALSRNDLTFSGISLTDIEAAQKAIVGVERAITDDILRMEVARDVVAMTPLDYFRGLDAKFVATEALININAHWDELEEDRNKWKDAYENELYV